MGEVLHINCIDRQLFLYYLIKNLGLDVELPVCYTKCVQDHRTYSKNYQLKRWGEWPGKIWPKAKLNYHNENH
jgi:hypothetical protein